jgi:hypothetical protein
MLFLYPFHEIQSLNFSPRVFFLFQIPKMAQSRLEKVGTIYSRMRGLLATGAVKPEQVCTRSCGSDPVGSGTLFTGRIGNSLSWSDLERLVLVGSGTLCTGRIRNSLNWPDPEAFVLVGFKKTIPDQTENDRYWQKNTFYCLQNV